VPVKFENGHAGIGPGRAALRIDQDIRLNEKALARGQRIEPIGAGIGASGRKARAATQIGAIEHVANAKHPLVELDIAADLAAAGNSSRVCRERSTDGVALVDFGPGTADVYKFLVEVLGLPLEPLGHDKQMPARWAMRREAARQS